MAFPDFSRVVASDSKSRDMVLRMGVKMATLATEVGPSPTQVAGYVLGVATWSAHNHSIPVFCPLSNKH